MTRKLRDLIRGANHTCPRWLCFTFDNPVRRLVHDPVRLLGPYVEPGDRVLDLGAGTGYFTIPLAALVGRRGEVVAADIQQSMLDAVARRARRRGVDNVRPLLLRETAAGELTGGGDFDFALLFWMLHEVREREPLLRGVRDRLTPEARLLLVEPRGHVSGDLFQRELDAARSAGLTVADRPRVSLSRAALLQP